MRIDQNNLEDLRRHLWLHDSKVTSMAVDINLKRIAMCFTQHYYKTPQQFEYVFHDVIYLQMTNHSPWLGSENINGIHFDDKAEFQDRYHPLWENVMKVNPEDRDESFLDDKLMVTINFISGNITRIICSAMDVEEKGPLEPGEHQQA